MDRRAWKRWWPWTCVVIVWMLGGTVGCEGDNPVAPSDEFAPPTDLTFINGETRITLSWTASADAMQSDFAGYNIYRGTTSLAGLSGADLEMRKVNGDPETNTTFFDDNVALGVRYYYQVRAITDGGTLSEPTAEVDTAARTELTGMSIAEFASPQPSGFDLSTGMTYMMTSSSPDNRPFIDFYLGTLAAGDGSTGDLAAKSPSLVLGGSAAWAGRVAAFKMLADFDVSSTTSSGWTDTIALGATADDIVGKVFAVRAPADDQGEVHYGKVEIVSLSGDAGLRQVGLKWTYQPIADYVRF